MKHNRGSRGLSRFPRDWTCHPLSHLVMTVPGLVRKMKTRDCKYLFRTVVSRGVARGCSEKIRGKTYRGRDGVLREDVFCLHNRFSLDGVPLSSSSLLSHQFFMVCGCGSVPVSAFSVSLLGQGEAIALAVLALACQDDDDDEERTRTSGPRRLVSCLLLSVF